MTVLWNDRQWWNAHECADYWEVQTNTWRTYVSKGLSDANLIPSRFDPDTGMRLWRADRVREWKRPGKGNWKNEATG